MTGPTWQIICADVLDGLRQLPDGSVHCVVTSPPYWGLRDYGKPGQIGLERTYPEYVAKLVDVFREIYRVLRKDGTAWLNLGDTAATGAGSVGDHPGGGKQGARWAGATPERGERSRSLRDDTHNGKHTAPTAMGPMTQPNRMPQPGLKPKSLIGIPWRVAFALQDDGWILRQDIIWHKKNPMPESVRDRCTRSHEYLFLLAKSARYHYDADAIAEPAVRGAAGSRFDAGKTGDHQLGRASTVDRVDRDLRNKRSVWSISIAQYPGAHYAVMPEALVEPCILAGCPPGGTVLDPFFGSGTVGDVALRLGRSVIGIDLNPDYVQQARRRIIDAAPLFNVQAEIVQGDP